MKNSKQNTATSSGLNPLIVRVGIILKIKCTCENTEKRKAFSQKVNEVIYQQILSAAATESANTCYLCGNSATVQSKGWILPYCQVCAEKQSDYPAAFRPSRPI